jgi:hypothetical protein
LSMITIAKENLEEISNIQYKKDLWNLSWWKSRCCIFKCHITLDFKS